jgi:endonuclease/exonuclease/phosphatase family metal-dependent hydrolase
MKKIIIILLLTIFSVVVYSQGDNYAVFYWNVENLFHPANDSTGKDEEFTPGGVRSWTWYRYNSKITRIWKTIIAAGNEKPPAVICLAEIENEKVLKDLFIYSPPGKFEYKILHEESRDRRGIDVAILYDPGRMELLSFRVVPVDLRSVGGRETRDIMNAVFKCREDSFHIFLNHWPSKYGGAGVTEKFRMKASLTLSNKIREIHEKTPGAKILCLGDFNDYIDSPSMKQLERKADLVPLKPHNAKNYGSLKYQGVWEMIDHLLVSPDFLNTKNGLHVGMFSLFCPDFLLEGDDKYGGRKPFRTWQGYRYQEGFSDHLPLLINLSF